MRTLEKILVQRDLCDGCLDCEKACSSIHGTPRINIIEFEGSYYPILCQQCQDSPCVNICPTEAMSNLGIDSEKCIACGLCSIVCPFGSITVCDKSSQKCNRCEDREEGPACIQACSKRAISLVDSEKLKTQKQKEYISKLSGSKKKTEKHNLINVLTSDTRASKPYNKG